MKRRYVETIVIISVALCILLMMQYLWVLGKEINCNYSYESMIKQTGEHK